MAVLAWTWFGDSWGAVLAGVSAYAIFRFLRGMAIFFIVAAEETSGRSGSADLLGATLMIGTIVAYTGLFGYTARFYVDGWLPVGGIAFCGFLVGIAGLAYSIRKQRADWSRY